MTTASARWVLKLFGLDEKHIQLIMSRDNFDNFVVDTKRFPQQFVTTDETWVHYIQPEMEGQSKQWKHLETVNPKEVEFTCDCLHFLGCTMVAAGELSGKKKGSRCHRGIPHWSLEAATTDNQEDLAGEASKRVPFHQDKASSQMSTMLMAAIWDCGFELLQHLPFSSDSVLSDWYLSPRWRRSSMNTILTAKHHFHTNT